SRAHVGSCTSASGQASRIATAAGGGGPDLDAGAIHTRSGGAWPEQGCASAGTACSHHTRAADQPAGREAVGGRYRSGQTRKLPRACTVRRARHQSDDLRGCLCTCRPTGIHPHRRAHLVGRGELPRGSAQIHHTGNARRRLRHVQARRAFHGHGGKHRLRRGAGSGSHRQPAARPSRCAAHPELGPPGHEVSRPRPRTQPFRRSVPDRGVGGRQDSRMTMARTDDGASDPVFSLAWFGDCLRDELRPYAGRLELVARMVIAPTIVMLITMTFRIPFGSHGAIYTFFLSRESPRSTLKAATTIGVVVSASAVFALIGSIISAADPTLRLL